MTEKRERTEAEQEWLGHEQTERLRKEIQERKDKLLVQVVKSAESCTDANLVRYATEYRECERQLARLTR